MLLRPSPAERAANSLGFDASVIETEKTKITGAIKAQAKSYDGNSTASVTTALMHNNAALVLAAYVPVTDVYSVRQSITKAELPKLQVSIVPEAEAVIKEAAAAALGLSSLPANQKPLAELGSNDVVFIPISQLSSDVKLLSLEGAYYLDSYNQGALFRIASFSGTAAESLSTLDLNDLKGKDGILKVNQSGVTALTRLMQRKLAAVKDPKYFSAKIGSFMSDADITHVSNEVSFRDGCQYSNGLFCSPPEFIETLKDSGVDLVEITGNHNNDNGSTYNTESIKLYQGLGWNVFGGGLNSNEARKPYVADIKGTKAAFIGYNMADGAGSGAIAGTTTAGANIYARDKAKADIEAAKQAGQFVIVDIQYAECQAYPAGYTEFPACDGPIGGQEQNFKEMIDLGADMVVGSSAHQPQTYELYKGKAIYYGLGNMYFDQTQWPGTERGIILTHYFDSGKLLQTKLSPTVYDASLQTRLMDAEEAGYLLTRLQQAR